MAEPQRDPNGIFVTEPAHEAPQNGPSKNGAPEDADDLQPSLPPARWRVIIEEAARSGAVNMALDQAIAEACAAGASLPTLRFYRWDPPAVSLGRHQPLADIDLEAVAARGYEVVRRPTGGRAILHIDELTYSVAAPADEPRVRGGVMDAYLRLSTALLLGLRNIGLLDADKAPGTVRTAPDVSAACFEVPSAYEITVGARKLMGSAQSRRAGYVLQHGSLPLTGDVARLVDVLALPAATAAKLRRDLGARACTLAQALSVDDSAPAVDFAHTAHVLADAFSTQLNIEFVPQGARPDELRRAAELVRTQFADATWTGSR